MVEVSGQYSVCLHCPFSKCIAKSGIGKEWCKCLFVCFFIFVLGQVNKVLLYLFFVVILSWKPNERTRHRWHWCCQPGAEPLRQRPAWWKWGKNIFTTPLTVAPRRWDPWQRGRVCAQSCRRYEWPHCVRAPFVLSHSQQRRENTLRPHTHTHLPTGTGPDRTCPIVSVFSFRERQTAIVNWKPLTGRPLSSALATAAAANANFHCRALSLRR